MEVVVGLQSKFLGPPRPSNLSDVSSVSLEACQFVEVLNRARCRLGEHDIGLPVHSFEIVPINAHLCYVILINIYNLFRVN